MKLNLKIETKSPKSDIWGYDKLALYNPIGWWSVTTEGDCEGRSTRNLGTHYGHVAEIAFAMRKESGYSLNFEPSKASNIPEPIPTYTAVAGAKEKVLGVHITLAYGMTDGCEPNPDAVAAWLDADGVKVTKSNYYHAIKLEMKVA